MKSFKTFLHLLITGASLAGFVGGWAVFAHSPKPLQPSDVQALQPLEPLPAIGQAGQNDQSSLLGSIFAPRPRRNYGYAYMTRGS